MNKGITSSFSQTNVLISGGAGFIGSHLAEALVSTGANVTIVDNLSSGSLQNLAAIADRIELVTDDLGNVLQPNSLDLSSYQYIFHIAANPYIPWSVENPDRDFHSNLSNTFQLLEALRGMKEAPHLINTSSAAVYGNPVRLPICETDQTVPISPYGVSKLAAERYVAVYNQIYGIKASSLRLFSVYGPRQRKQVVYDLLSKLHANPQQIQVLGDGSQARDFVFVKDVVRAMLLIAVDAPAKGETYNVASGTTHTIAELVGMWSKVYGASPEILYSGQVRPGDAERWSVDISRLQELGYKAQTTLEEGLIAIRDWYLDEDQKRGQ